MALKLYNTLTDTEEHFVPLDPKNVRMYVCGPTVYDYAHIGNARPVIVFDVLFRLLRHLYGEAHVSYVRNVTDIDDKINARARERVGERNVPILDVVRELTAETGRVYEEDMAALGNLEPTHRPHATKHIDAMIRMIEALIETGHAYEAEGHVLFDVSSKPDYGKLSRRSLDEMIAGARVDVAPYKRGPMDFVLWKPSDNETPGWESPWGRGRPGWHIECSAMSAIYLGETFDIHGGGIDLLFPHHENEIAQSESAHHGRPLARIWMHNGFLNVEGEKMSKSLGNFVTVRDVLNDWHGTGWSGEAVRFSMLHSHYTQPIDWTAAGIELAHRELRSLCEGLEGVDRTHVATEIIEALFDNLNTPLAIKRFHELKKQGRKGELLASLNLIGLSGNAANVMRRLSITHRTPFELRSTVTTSSGDIISKELSEEVQRLVDARSAARKTKNFKEADRIRDELLAKGIVLMDGPSGTTWEVKR